MVVPEQATNWKVVRPGFPAGRPGTAWIEDDGGTVRMGEQEQRWPGDDAPGVPQDEAAQHTRQAQEAHGGSMAPGLVDDTGRPVTDPPSVPSSAPGGAEA
ncbi:hypothetical protein ACTMSW_30495 [Micromonospora sp. BQ11]|uniref:hypothetical protein n=1 Tax=Micromonospora sp. BQ11 TaxID=3452212 RepID=UPI003F8C58C7